MIGCENAMGIMTKLQTSLSKEETWVDGATEKLTALPTATSALELDVSKYSLNKYISNDRYLSPLLSITFINHFTY